MIDQRVATIARSPIGREDGRVRLLGAFGVVGQRGARRLLAQALARFDHLSTMRASAHRALPNGSRRDAWQSSSAFFPRQTPAGVSGIVTAPARSARNSCPRAPSPIASGIAVACLPFHCRPRWN